MWRGGVVRVRNCEEVCAYPLGLEQNGRKREKEWNSSEWIAEKVLKIGKNYSISTIYSSLHYTLPTVKETHKPVVLMCTRTVQVLCRTYSIVKPPNVIDNASLHAPILNVFSFVSTQSFNLKRTSTSHLFGFVYAFITERRVAAVQTMRTLLFDIKNAISFHFRDTMGNVAGVFVSIHHPSAQLHRLCPIRYEFVEFSIQLIYCRIAILLSSGSSRRLIFRFDTKRCSPWFDKCYGWQLDLIPSARQYCMSSILWGALSTGIFFLPFIPKKTKMWN